MSNFHGMAKRHSYFEGWYFKQTGEDGTVAFIPAFHVNNKGERWASLQVITEQNSFNLDFPEQEFKAAQSRFLIQLAMSRFAKNGCRLEMKEGAHSVTGILNYENVRRPKYDIMGPFALVPFLECRHRVVSLHHRVSGTLNIDGKKFRFNQGLGYIEGDRGRSFPRQYCWTQCYWDEGGIMLSIAEIPFLGKCFTGGVGFLYIDGKEYRLATYLGLKLVEMRKDYIHIHQGSLELIVKLIDENPRPLKAPCRGSMDRTIHESLACTVYYEARRNGRTILEHYSQTAGFEWV